MPIDPAVKRLIQTIAKAEEHHFADRAGNIDSDAQSRHVLDAIEQRHEDMAELLGSESPLWTVESAIGEMSRKTHTHMKREDAEEVDSQPQLPDFDKVKRIEVKVAKGGGKFNRKKLLSCTIGELDIIDLSYGNLADTLLQHQQFVRDLAKLARQMGLKETDTVRKLYSVA